MKQPSKRPLADNPEQGHRGGVRTETLSAIHDGRRIDNVLLSFIKGAPRSLIYKLLRSGQVRINGRRAKPHARVATGDRIRIPPTEMHDRQDRPIPPSRLQSLQNATVYEDENYLVVDKPSGMSCHAGSGVRYGLIEIMRESRPQVERLDLAHRIDRETSGLVLLTKNLDALHHFQTQLDSNDVVKEYRTLLRGRIDSGIVDIEQPLGVERNQGTERRTSVSQSGKAAHTKIIERRFVGPHTAATVAITTGRMHQIRAHMEHLGHPVAGDRRYGNKQFNQQLKALGLRRLFLHAARLEFNHPGGRVSATARLPAELEAVLTQLAAV